MKFVDRFVSQSGLDNFCKANCSDYTKCSRSLGSTDFINSKTYELYKELLKKSCICTELKLTFIGTTGLFKRSPLKEIIHKNLEVIVGIHHRLLMHMHLMPNKDFIYIRSTGLNYLGDKQLYKIKKALLSEEGIREFKNYIELE
jgi:hypothetical protein